MTPVGEYMQCVGCGGRGIQVRNDGVIIHCPMCRGSINSEDQPLDKITYQDRAEKAEAALKGLDEAIPPEPTHAGMARARYILNEYFGREEMSNEP